MAAPLFIVQAISIHALREEGDQTGVHFASPPFNFYPRPPRGGRPCRSDQGVIHRSNFYPRPPRGGRHESTSFTLSVKQISIHALREEGDIYAGITNSKGE